MSKAYVPWFGIWSQVGFSPHTLGYSCFLFFQIHPGPWIGKKAILNILFPLSRPWSFRGSDHLKSSRPAHLTPFSGKLCHRNPPQLQPPAAPSPDHSTTIMSLQRFLSSKETEPSRNYFRTFLPLKGMGETGVMLQACYS